MEDLSSQDSVLSTDSDCCFEDTIFSGDSCTCGAGGRAHKKDCPMSSRNRYPSRILFPGGSSAVPVSPRSDKPCKSDKPGSTVSDAGSSMLGKREKPKQDQPPPAKKQRCSTSSYTYKVGDRVCIHTHRLDKHHIPCRVALVVGKSTSFTATMAFLKVAMLVKN